MKLDKHVVDMFTELTKPADDVKMEKTCYGTISVVDGTRYVKLDGSDLLVPAASTVKTSHGDRVTVLMKNHSLTVTGNLTAPATDGEGGSSGEAGTAATIEVGTVTTGEAGSSASVTNSGTASAAVFDFVIPKGDKGDKGEKGDTGPQGPQGEKGDTGTWDGTIPDHQHAVSDILNFPTSLPARGGNADTVDGKHANNFSQIIDFSNISTDTKTAIGIPYKITTYRCTNWTDYPTEAPDGQGMIIAAHYNGDGTVGVNEMWVRQLFITPHYNYKIWQRLIVGTTVGEWANIADGGNAANAQSLNGFTVPNSGLELIGNPTVSGSKPALGAFDDTNGSHAFYDIRLSNGDAGRIQIDAHNAADVLVKVYKYTAETNIWAEGLVNRASSANFSYHQYEHFLNDGFDILAYTTSDHCPTPFNTIVRIKNSPTCPTNYGYSASDNDFFYHVFKLDNSWATVKAYDIRGHFEYINSCYNGTWTGWIKSSDGGNADTLDGLHANEIASNPNLLINPDFKINQRGQSVYSGKRYTVDGWKCITSAGRVTVGDSGITVTNTAGKECKIQNYVERDLTGKTITLSACIDGTVYKVSGIATTDMTTWSKQLKVYFDDKGYLLFGSHQVSPPLFFVMLTSSAGKSFTCQWVKLELGGIATPFTPTDPATELAKCQRYYQIRSANYNSVVDLSPSMRIAPTVTQIGSSRYAYSAGF